MKGSLFVNRKRFRLAGSISLITTLAVIISLVLTGTVFAAMPLAGVGGVVVRAHHISGSNVLIIPSLHSTNIDGANQTAANSNSSIPVFPQSQITMTGVTINNLQMLKEIDLSHLDIPLNPINFVQVDITATGNATGSGLLMNADQINAEEADLTTMAVEENMLLDPTHNAQDKPVSIPSSYWLPNGYSTNTQTWQTSRAAQTMADVGIRAAGLEMSSGVINSHYLKMDSIQLPKFQLALDLYGVDHSGNPFPVDFSGTPTNPAVDANGHPIFDNQDPTHPYWNNGTQSWDKLTPSLP